VLESGTPEQIRTSPKPEIQALLNRKPRENVIDIDAHLRALMGEAPVAEEDKE
jgi:hypothetical protein